MTLVLGKILRYTLLASEILLVSEPNAIKQLPPMALAAGPLAHRGHKAPKDSVSVGCPLAQHMAAGGGCGDGTLRTPHQSGPGSGLLWKPACG